MQGVAARLGELRSMATATVAHSNQHSSAKALIRSWTQRRYSGNLKDFLYFGFIQKNRAIFIEIVLRRCQ